MSITRNQPVRLSLLKAHGSGNDIYIVESSSADLSAALMPRMASALSDRRGIYGADGVYFLPTTGHPRFYNPDGTEAEVCGNGLRCVGRLLLERSGSTRIVLGELGLGVECALREGPYVEVVVDLPSPAAEPSPAQLLGDDPNAGAWAADLRSDLRFDFVSTPNPHIVALVDRFDGTLLTRVGRRANEHRTLFPAGVNVSFALAMDAGDVFVATYERGVGRTLSCGSAIVATRIVWHRQQRVPPGQRLLFRSPGAAAESWLDTGSEDSVIPKLRGNATFVYRTDATVETVLNPGSAQFEGDFYTDEVEAFAMRADANMARIQQAGIQVGHADGL